MKPKYLLWRRIAWVAITGLLAIFSSFAQPVQPAGAAKGANYYRMKKVQLIDQYGFERPMPVASMLLPADWQFQGQAVYGKDHGCSMVQTSFHATSGDGRMSMDLLPAYTWQWADDPGVLQSMRVTAQQGAPAGRQVALLHQPVLLQERKDFREGVDILLRRKVAVMAARNCHKLIRNARLVQRLL